MIFKVTKRQRPFRINGSVKNELKMEKYYRKIEFGAGNSIERAIRDLSLYKEHGELVCGEFNGKMLYSDVDDLDSAYVKITGKTKAEFDEVERIRYEEYQDERRWIEKGNLILDKKYHELWAKCVPIRLNDLYKGMELGATLDIVKELNAGCELTVAKGIIKEQGHSGMSFGLVCSMVKSFCDRGEEFVNYARS